MSRDVSERTLRLLVPEDGVPRVDAVVFLLRTLNAADIALLKQIGQLVGGSAGALGVIGVASRADEIGAGRIDAMTSAKDVAKRFTAEMDKTGICQAVVPVSGLLALTARTLRQSEFVALQKLAGVESTELTKALLSVDRFAREDSTLPVDSATRAALLGRFGMFGLRISIALLRAGVTDSVALADELLERSGLTSLRDVIDAQFAQRSDLLKAHTALLSLRRFVQANPIYATQHIVAECVWTRCLPRYSQGPASGSMAKRTACLPSGSSRRNRVASPMRGSRSSMNICEAARMTLPYASCCSCSAA